MTTLILRDGRSLSVRPLCAADAGRLEDAFQRLSPRSRFRRFLCVTNRLPPEHLRYLTDVDQRDHLALAAFDPTLPGAPLVGVVRCIRLEDAPHAADLAVTVVDSHQGLGMGTLLLGALARWIDERQAGITALRADVDAGNAPMLELLEQLGARRLGEEEGTVTFEVPVPRVDEGLPDTPAGRAIRAAGRGELAIR